MDFKYIIHDKLVDILVKEPTEVDYIVAYAMSNGLNVLFDEDDDEEDKIPLIEWYEKNVSNNKFPEVSLETAKFTYHYNKKFNPKKLSTISSALEDIDSAAEISPAIFLDALTCLESIKNKSKTDVLRKFKDYKHKQRAGESYRVSDYNHYNS
jgi:hypothetical protein